jgi:miniconductance mechanosensitive channel
MALLLVAVIINLIVKKVIIELFVRFTVSTQTNLMIGLVKNKVPNNVAHISIFNSGD